jgi:hypothetical protein
MLSYNIMFPGIKSEQFEIVIHVEAWYRNLEKYRLPAVKVKVKNVVSDVANSMISRLGIVTLC